jgi:hypothetical protein
MAYNGSGTYTRVHDWTTDEGNAVNITASRMDAEDDGFATGLSTAICKDGQTTTTAAINFAVGLRVTDGVVGTPSLAFISDTDTGFYRTGSGAVALSLDGVARATFGKDTAATVTINSAATNTVTNVLKLTSQSSGTPAAGIGAGIALVAETSAGNDEIGAVIEAVTTDVTSTSEDFDLVFKTMAAGAAADEKFRITSTDVLKQTIGSTTYAIATPVVLVAEAASGSVASIDIENLPAGTKELKIRITDVQPADDATIFCLRLSTDNGATYLSGASDYGYQNTHSFDTVVSAEQDFTSTIIQLALNLDNAAADVMGEISVFFKASGRAFVTSAVHYTDTSAAYGTTFAQGYTDNTCNAVQLFMSTGNISMTYSVIAIVG